MKKTISVMCVASLLSACTGTLKPVGVRSGYSAFEANKNLVGSCSAPTGLTLNHLVAPETGDATTRLTWLNCEMLAKSMDNFVQAGKLENRNEWRDLPLFLSALTAAALVLFGKRGADGNLTSGEVDVLEGIALGTAGFVVLADYLSPNEAADLLYTSAEGHRCLSEHGQTVAAYAPIVLNKADEYQLVRDRRSTLAGLIETTGTDAEKQAARAELLRADRAIAFYLEQKTAKEIAPARSYTTAYDFGLELTKRARRQPQSISQIQSAIAEQLRLQRENAGIDARQPPGGEMQVAGEDENVTNATRNLSSAVNSLAEGMPNLALLVNGMTLCKTNALAGAPLPSPEIKYFGVAAGD